MLRNSMLIGSGICLCHNSWGLDNPKSTCCYTPDIEPESLTKSEQSFIIDLKKAPSLAKKGNAVYVDNHEKNIRMIVVRVKKNNFLAFSRHCSHGNQALSYIPERKLLQCNSYNHSLFDLDGSVWKGPAPDPIKVYPVKNDKNKLEIFYM
jgi:Rieske Fe-S protein